MSHPFCTRNQSIDLAIWHACAWRPAHLHECILQQIAFANPTGRPYNELILDYRHFIALLPASIEAIFVTTTTSQEDVETAHQVLAAFADEYGLEGPAVPPLVQYDPWYTPSLRQRAKQEEGDFSEGPFKGIG